MKINGITATEYHLQDADLVVTMKDTTIDNILAMNTALLMVTTDAGDTADVFGGMTVRAITYDVDHDQFVTIFGRAFDDSEAGKAITALTEELSATKKELEATVNATKSEVENNNTSIQLAIAELASATEQSSTANQLAIAELATTVMDAIAALSAPAPLPETDEEAGGEEEETEPNPTEDGTV